MIPAQFDYQKASTLDEALSLIAQDDVDVKVIAGGHSLLPVMKLRLATPEKIVDIAGLSELNYIRESGDFLEIGALTTHSQIAESSVISEKMPALADAANLIGDPQIRNMGTIGGSLSHSDPGADYPGALLALDAEVDAQSSSGKRTIKISDFFVDLYENALEEEELIVAVRIPVNAQNQNSCYLKFPNPASRFPIVGCAVAMEKDGNTCKQVRVGFSGVAPAAFRDSGIENALAGQALNEDAISEASSKAAEGQDVMGDQMTSEEYRRHLATVFAKQAISQVS